MTQNNRFNSKERTPKGCIPKRHTSKRRTPKRHIPKKRVSKRRVSKSITLSIALTLLHSFAAEASPEAHMPETRVPETRVSEQTNADTRVHVLKMAENKRIEASICADSMNRIAVTNDRITQIFGDEGTFESQNDEATGQVFLKPTVENGSKNLSLTLITEQGVTQDLTLKPTAKSAKTLVLARDTLERVPLGHVPLVNDADHQAPLNRGFLQPMPESQLGIGKIPLLQEQLLTLIKQAMSGQLPFTDASGTDASGSEEETISRQHPFLEGCYITLDQSWQAGSFMVHSFQVENVTESSLELQEKDFYQQGDLALSFDTRVSGTSISQKRVLPPEGKTTLYVVSHRKVDLL